MICAKQNYNLKEGIHKIKKEKLTIKKFAQNSDTYMTNFFFMSKVTFSSQKIAIFCNFRLIKFNFLPTNQQIYPSAIYNISPSSFINSSIVLRNTISKRIEFKLHIVTHIEVSTILRDNLGAFKAKKRKKTTKKLPEKNAQAGFSGLSLNRGV